MADLVLVRPRLNTLSVTAILTTILITILGIAVGVFLQDPVQNLVVRIAGKWLPKTSRNFKGLWRVRYTYGHRVTPVNEVHYMELRQFGSAVHGRYCCGDAPDYRLSGRIRFGHYLTGTFENLDPNDISHGAFQLFMTARGRQMDGKWVGLYDQRNLGHGEFHWEFVAPLTGKTAVANAIELCRSANVPEKWTGVTIAVEDATKA